MLGEFTHRMYNNEGNKVARGEQIALRMGPGRKIMKLFERRVKQKLKVF